jgi:hypothetical protein
LKAVWSTKHTMFMSLWNTSDWLPFDPNEITFSAATKDRISPAQGGSRWKFQKTTFSLG